MDTIYYGDQSVEVAPDVDFSILGERPADGVYIGMDEDTYHAAPALSTSGIKHLLTSPMDFWARMSWLNPEYEDEGTDAKDMGKAYHKRVVEGREAFYANYAPALDPRDYPAALTTADEIKERLVQLGAKVSGKKSDLIARLLESDPSAEIWDTLVSEHAEVNKGKDLLSFDLIKRIELSAAMIEKHPQLGKAFTGGYPEVSIFWTDEAGIPMKARLDYLKRQAVVDLKTFSNPFGKPIDRAVAYAIASYKYHIQVAVYMEAVKYAKSGLEWHGAADDFRDKFAKADDPEFLFVFQQTGVAPVARGYVFPKHLSYDCGQIEVRNAKNQFAQYVGAFGKTPWVDMTDIRTLDDTEFPAFMTAG